MKLCKDCNHCGRFSGKIVCARTKMTNSVTGAPFYRTCENERTDSHRIRFFQSNCGSRGRFWEPKTGVQTVAQVLDRNTVVTPTGFRWETPADGQY